ncbi:MAG: lauroyl acyltransferase [Alphaproteobacteria bacterium]|nr:lauroyl acyltransferase [Alphaproteobacteria bacterium]
MKRLVYVIQGIPALVLVGLFRLIPLDAGSAIGGWLGRHIGPLLPRSAQARTALETAFPEKKPLEIERILVAMWDNYFRTAIEYAHLPRLLATSGNNRVEIVDEQKLRAAMATGKPVLIFSGHIANWEVVTLPLLRQGGRIGVVYRKSNNPIVDRLITARRGVQDYELLPKGRRGAAGMLSVVKAGGSLAMLVDQKHNEGIVVPFLGRDAMTSTATADLAHKFGVVILPVRPERLGGARFRVTVADPVACDAQAERGPEIARVTAAINDILSGWIRNRPEQWMWFHRRWPDERPL